MTPLEQHCTVLLPAPYDRPAWLKARHGGLGGSEAATALGLNPYQSAYELCLDKMAPPRLDEDEPGPDDPRWWGNELEDDVATAFEVATGLTTVPAPGLLASIAYPFMYASPDRLVLDGDTLVGLLECKTTNHFRATEWVDDELPTPALLQTHHYLIVTGLPRAWVAGLIGGQRFVVKDVAPDPALHQHIIQAERTFWQCVQDGTPPPPDGSRGAGQAVRERWPASTTEDAVVLSPAEYDAVRRMRALDAQMKDLARAKDALVQGLQDRMGEHPAAIYDDQTVARWTNVTTQRLDTTALKKAHPQLVAEFTKATTSRRFTTPNPKEA
jgi:putative phage-type endonuclease